MAISGETIRRHAAEAHDVAIDPDRAEALSAEVETLNSTVLELATRHLTFADDPAQFARVLERQRDRFGS